MKRVPLALLLAIAACGKTGPPPPADPPPEIPALTDMPAPEPREPEILPLPAPPGSVELRWDFADGRLHSFRLAHEGTSTAHARFRGPLHEQNARERFEMGRAELTKKMKAEGKSGEEIARFMEEETRKFHKWLDDPLGKRTSRLESDGYVDFRGAGSGRGRIEYRLAPRAYLVDGREQDVNKLPPTLFTAQIDEDGTVFGLAKRSGEPDPLLFDIVFALPPMPLATGEWFERTIDLPAQKERLARQGTARTTLAGWGQVGPYECAKLVTDVDLTILPPPPAEGHGRLRARVIAWFAPAEKRFARADLAMTISMRTRTHVASGDGPKVWTIGSMDSVSRFGARISD